ncbi:MAG TPA: DUF6692 family protein [Geminicoccus sp.]|jgi:hypothetical protein|uniref:DUF6692 family protein n=1 Tax=Geminicoccus sp. TaxID=2024832 RepID=UPI002E3270D2|nr:DUF6692 family protein [Geminicoccus sp.]HEX2526427.1 DUF6692 family protein [Geminicoccus sp.]
MASSFARVGRAPLLLGLALGLLAGCGQDDAPDDQTQAARPPEIATIVPAPEALAGAQIQNLDPATMNGAEIRQVMGTAPVCLFRYTSAGKPVLAAASGPSGATGDGVVKLNGHLVALQAASPDPGGEQAGTLTLAADPVRLTVTPDPGAPTTDDDGTQRREATMIFEVNDSLRVGYRGYVEC